MTLLRADIQFFFHSPAPSVHLASYSCPNSLLALHVLSVNIRILLVSPFVVLAALDTSAIPLDFLLRNAVELAHPATGAARTQSIRRAILVAQPRSIVLLLPSVLCKLAQDTIPPIQPIHRISVRHLRLVCHATSVFSAMVVVCSVNVLLVAIRTIPVLRFVRNVSLAAFSPALEQRSVRIVHQVPQLMKTDK